MNRLEDRIRRSLHNVASDLPDAHVVALVVASPRRPRLRGLVAAGITFLLALTIGLPALLLSGQGPSQDVGSSSADVTSASGFPQVVVGVDQLNAGLELAYAMREPAPVRTAPPSHLQVFGPADSGSTSRLLWLVTDQDGSDFFRGEAYLDTSWKPVEIDSGRAFISAGTNGSMLAWDPGDAENGPAVFAYAINVETDALIDLVRRLRPASEGWTPTTLPDGFTELYNGPARQQGETVLLGWSNASGDEVEVALELGEVGEVIPNQLLLSLAGPDVAFNQAISGGDVRGHDAVRLTSGGGQVMFMWMETPTIVARLVVLGDSLDPDAVVAALSDVDDATWSDLFESSPAVGGGSPASTMAPSSDSTLTDR